MRNVKCSFCSREASEVKKIVTANSGPGSAAICDECANAIHNIITSSLEEEAADQSEIKKPVDIKKYLDQYVIAQDSPKRQVAVAVYNHFKQNKYNESKSNKKEPLDNTNILCLGKSGSGK